MSSRIFQSVIIQIKEATDRCIGIIDDQGFVITCSELPMIGSRLDDFSSMNYDFSEPVLVSGVRTYKVLSNNSSKFDYAVFVEGCDDMARMTCMMAAVAFNEAKMNYEEKYNKAAFLKNIISDNILPGDVYVRTKELHFAPDVPRALLLVRQVERSDVASVEVLQTLFPDKQHDFVISDNSAEVKAIAESVETVLRNELQIKCIIGIGTTARHLRELADRYKEAQIAIDVGRVFDSEKTIISYENLGIGRIIYQLPTTLCEMFLNEVFKKNPLETLDEDTLETINKFFENNLNVSETSRKLYVHRNTLEKIKKITGLDLREFDHAIVFKVAMMVKQYLDSVNSNGR